jgi:RNA polymerase sigma-70 factor (ECF subfamily)
MTVRAPTGEQRAPPHAATNAADAALQLAAQRGDRDAFAGLVERHSHHVHALCARILGPSADAADAAQEAFVRAYYALNRYDPALPFVAWVLSIARNACLDVLRRRRDRKTDLVEVPEAASAEPDVLSRAVDRETALRVNGALGRLDLRYREVLTLYHYNDQSYAEIARILGVPIGTVMTWIHRGRRALRDALEEKQQGDAA